eukprot:1194601-Prorocentrum_minimum.AAC.6
MAAHEIIIAIRARVETWLLSRLDTCHVHANVGLSETPLPGETSKDNYPITMIIRSNVAQKHSKSLLVYSKFVSLCKTLKRFMRGCSRGSIDRGQSRYATRCCGTYDRYGRPIHALTLRLPSGAVHAGFLPRVGKNATALNINMAIFY